MIPKDYITQWRSRVPWVLDAQVEQDLVISKALVQIFSHPVLREAFAFRGGTALYKLYLTPAARYSEDIDLVQVRAEPAGPAMDALQEIFNPWLGKPTYKQTKGRVTFRYRFDSEDSPAVPLRLKIEINTREHFCVEGFTRVPFEVSSRWFNGVCEILSYDLNELLGTKLRALYQRNKGRDLFDLGLALEQPDADPERIIAVFNGYMKESGHHVTRTQFEANLRNKLEDRNFIADISPLLSADYECDMNAMAELVFEHLIYRLEVG